MSLVYGEFESDEDLNETARNLRASGANDDLVMLCNENGISPGVCEAFINRTTDSLVGGEEDEHTVEVEAVVDVASQEETKTTKVIDGPVEKLTSELSKIKSGQAKPIVDHLLMVIEADEGFGNMVMDASKSLAKCLDYVIAQAKKKLTGDSRLVVAVSDEVFGWAVEYYCGEAEKPVITTKEQPKKAGLDEFTKGLLAKATANKEKVELAKAERAATPVGKKPPLVAVPRKEDKPKVEPVLKDQIAFDFGGLV